MFLKKIVLVFCVMGLIANVHAGDHLDDDLLQAAIALSLGEQNQREQKEIERTIALSTQPQQISAKQSRSPLFAYVTQLLKKQDQSIDRLFRAPDYTEWQKLWGIVGLKNTPTAVDVVLQLSDLKESCHKDNDAGMIGLADQALLQIFSGCWGISDKRAEPTLEQQLKGILQGVGRTFAEREPKAEKFNETIFCAFNAHGVLKSKPHLNDHFFTVFQCLGEGYSGTSEVPVEFLWQGKGFSQSIQIDGRQFDAFFEKTGYLVPLESLIQKTRLKLDDEQKGKLEQYLQDFDTDNPRIQENLGNLKLFWEILKAQPSDKKSTPKALENLLFKGILNGVANDQRETLIDILAESLKVTDFKRQKDTVYETALKWEKSTKNQNIAQKIIKDLGQTFFTWLMEYIGKIEQDNRLFRIAYVIKYPGFVQYAGVTHLQDRLGKQMKIGEEIAPIQFQWIANQPQDGKVAGAVEEQVPTGIKNSLYQISDGKNRVSNTGRLIDYLIARGRIDPSLKLPILLMLNISMLD